MADVQIFCVNGLRHARVYVGGQCVLANGFEDDILGRGVMGELEGVRSEEPAQGVKREQLRGFDCRTRRPMHFLLF